MTAYHGGKFRSGSAIAAAILQHSDPSHATYIEPFCGMCSVLVPIVNSGQFQSHHASDTNLSVIKMWQGLLDGSWLPLTQCTKEMYMSLKDDNTSTADKGFIGHHYSFGGAYFASYTNRPVSVVARRMKNSAKILSDKVNFQHGDYQQMLEGIHGATIYCDPPYNGVSVNYYDDNRRKVPYDASNFWSLIYSLSQTNSVFVSEYSVPEYIKPIARPVYRVAVQDTYHRQSSGRVDTLWHIKHDH